MWNGLQKKKRWVLRRRDATCEEFLFCCLFGLTGLVWSGIHIFIFAPITPCLYLLRWRMMTGWLDGVVREGGSAGTELSRTVRYQVDGDAGKIILVRFSFKTGIIGGTNKWTSQSAKTRKKLKVERGLQMIQFPLLRGDLRVLGRRCVWSRRSWTGGRKMPVEQQQLNEQTYLQVSIGSSFHRNWCGDSCFGDGFGEIIR